MELNTTINPIYNLNDWYEVNYYNEILYMANDQTKETLIILPCVTQNTHHESYTAEEVCCA